MNYQALKLNQFFREHYLLSPVSVMEFEFEPFGETDQDKRKSSVNFVKRMNVITPFLNELYDEQHHLFQAVSEMPCIYKLGFNKNAFYALVPHYVKLEKSLKAFKQLLKKHSVHPEVAAYYKDAEVWLESNIYEMMKSDFAEFEKVTTQRLEQYKAEEPEWDRWDEATPDWSVVNEKYKAAKAK